ncbi:Homeobox protein Meis3 [Rhizopus azygosporus]|uniref:Homeobox protein Meis3 n=1 Tax=Rhizopus azygosporus TaxID=86630 RepID=A0A367K9N2_RHIAZ|nr:Homeobox protein Meis3 [Rhizopus azygosporus]
MSFTTYATKSRSFCPLILYHDKPSKELSMNLNANRHQNQSAIDRHRERTNEMLLHNAQFWIEGPGLVEDDIKVSPSTSTTSNISSSSSEDSIATIDTYQHPRTTKYNQEQSHELSGGYVSSTPLEKSSSETTTSTPSTNGKRRRRGNLPKEVTEFLRKWLIQHKKHPYPAEKEKIDLAQKTGLTVNQISNWFINARRRILQPMLESESLCAQMMAYPELMNSDRRSNINNNRHRLDFYPYHKSSVEQSPIIHHYPIEERFMMHNTVEEYHMR